MSPFSSWLDSRMRGEGWDQKQLAKKLQVDESMVSKWLHDITTPTRRSATKLCLIFKVPADYLLPIIDYKDVIDITPIPEQNEKRAELLARVPALASILEKILNLPLEKQAAYLDLMANLLPGLDQKGPKEE